MSIVRVAYDIDVPDGKEKEVVDLLNSDREKGPKNFLKSLIVDEVEIPVNVIGRQSHHHANLDECTECHYRYTMGKNPNRGMPLPAWDN